MSVINLLTFIAKRWRKEWQPTPVFLPGEFQGQRSLADYNTWGCKESDTTEQLTLSLTFTATKKRDYFHENTLPGSSLHGILQAGILEWVAISFSKTNKTRKKSK